jgi:hypothetical protein
MLKQYDNAINSLDLALYVIGDKPEYSDEIDKVKKEKMRIETLKV